MTNIKEYIKGMLKVVNDRPVSKIFDIYDPVYNQGYKDALDRIIKTIESEERKENKWKFLFLYFYFQ